MARVKASSKHAFCVASILNNFLYILLLFGFFPFVQTVPKNLSLPDPKLCASRKINFRIGKTGYYASWLEKDTRNLFLNWLDARNWCRDRCMDLISMESAEEIKTVKRMMQQSKLKHGQTFCYKLPCNIFIRVCTNMIDLR